MKISYQIAAGLVLVAIGYVAIKKVQGIGGGIVDGVGDALEEINPFNNQNIINRGFTSLYQAVTGSDETLGADIYDVTHDGTFNPTSQNNLANRSANAWVHYLTGDKNQTLGGWIYDKTH